MRAQVTFCDICGSREDVCARVSMQAPKSEQHESSMSMSLLFAFGQSKAQSHDIDMCRACATGMIDIVERAAFERKRNETKAERAASAQSVLHTSDALKGYFSK